MIRRLLHAIHLLFTFSVTSIPEEDPNRPAWNREAWKRAGRRGYRPSRGK